MVKELPVARATPPDGLANQLMVPKLVVADKFKVPELHLVSPVTLVIVVLVTAAAVTAVRGDEVQLAVAVST